jgi:Uma2 family endonuclease
MGLPNLNHAYYTYGDYLKWPEDVRYELIDGEAYLMSPAPTVSHQDIAGEVYAQLLNALRGKPCRVLIAPVDVRLPKVGEADEADEQIDTVVQPDVLIVCDQSKVSERGLRGAPDWVLEVLSPATAGRDQVQKLELYERHGVREYWLIHPRDKVLTIYKRANGVDGVNRVYGRPHVQALAGQTRLNILDGVCIQWDEVVSRLPKLD